MRSTAHLPLRRRLLGFGLASGLMGAGRGAGARDEPHSSYGQRSEVHEFAAELASGHDLDPAWVRSCLAAGRRCPDADRWMAPVPSASRDWRRFRLGQLDPRRLARGQSFWSQYEPALARAQANFGTAPEFVVAILGIESSYGRLTGRYRTLDVLMTLAFDCERRAAEYREELGQFLLLCHEQSSDPTGYFGSIAGAIGLPQFLPSSIRRYALDFDHDGRVDIAHSATDAVGSVGHFLYQHGWRPDLPALIDVEVPATAMAGEALDAPRRWQQLQDLGLTSTLDLAPDESVQLIGLPYLDAQGLAAQEFRLGTDNLTVLLGYNRSHFYAAAVVDLALELRKGFQAGPGAGYSASG